MIILTSEEIQLILNIIREKYGPGYADDEKVGALQAKLSMMLQMKRTRLNQD